MPDAPLQPAARTVLELWFGRETDPGYGAPRDTWFRADAAFDRTVGEHCEALSRDAALGRLDGWADTPHGSLALLILLDQVPRNIFRGTPRVYATDPQARAQARAAIAAGFDRALLPVQRWFVYLPFEHSESLDDQDLSVALFERLPEHPERETTLRWVRRHREIIERFGRFPHRNAILGRSSTPEEEAFLKEPDSSF
ncbi:MAG TPA: DUF924 family protein [Candidatus Sulfotelmatobacter sp.]|nr:DUF924 family protein [Candidatus Sulfotelmatobacter sp.]